MHALWLHSGIFRLEVILSTVKPVLSGHFKKDQNLVFKADYRLMQVKSIAECSKEHSEILSTFIKLPFVFKIFVLSIFEWPLKSGFTVNALFLFTMDRIPVAPPRYSKIQA